MGRFVVRAEGPKVLINLNDRTYLELEPHVAEALGKAILAKAKEADEIHQAERIALDSAILMRVGAPFTLSNHGKILDLARNTASWDRGLRRAIPSIKSKEVFGLPSVIKGPPCT